jgi:hypothetical protein
LFTDDEDDKDDNSNITVDILTPVLNLPPTPNIIQQDLNSRYHPYCQPQSIVIPSNVSVMAHRDLAGEQNQLLKIFY